MSATRIMIFGGPGAGKSRLALRLSRILGIAVYCVDEAVHDGKGKLRPKSEIDCTVRSWASKHQWIMKEETPEPIRIEHRELPFLYV